MIQSTGKKFLLLHISLLIPQVIVEYFFRGHLDVSCSPWGELSEISNILPFIFFFSEDEKVFEPSVIDSYILSNSEIEQ